MHPISTLDILLAKFGGQLLIPFTDAAKIIGMPEQTARNKLSRGQFPIRTILIGARRMCDIRDVAGYVDALADPRTKKTKRGRKPKAEKITQIGQGAI